MYRIRLLDAATEELARLDPAVAARVVERMRWLATNLETIRPSALAGDLSGLYKLRVGDHRVLDEILRAERTVIVHKIGHRSAIYRIR